MSGKNRQLDKAAKQLADLIEAHLEKGAVVSLLRNSLVGNVRPALLTLLGAVGLVSMLYEPLQQKNISNVSFGSTHQPGRLSSSACRHPRAAPDQS